MNTYTELEDDVCTRLGALAVPAQVIIRPMPEVEEEFKLPTANQVYITVAAGQTETDNVKDVRVVHSDAMNTVRVIVQATKLRGNRGIYTIEKAVRLLLVGHKPANHHASLRYVKGQFIELEHDVKRGVWNYQLEFLCRGVILQDHTPEEELAVLVTQITHVSNLETTTVSTDNEIDGGYAGTLYDNELDGGNA